MKPNPMLRQPRQQKKRIKDIPVNLRPREKMVAYGAQNLSDAELLAILLNTGSVKQNALLLSDSLLRKYPLNKLVQVSTEELQKLRGIGVSKAARIVAGLELGKRIFMPASLQKITIVSTNDTLSQLRNIADKKQEYLIVLYLNARRELLYKETVGIGSLNTMRITPKEIFGPAFASPCASVIIAHNHPSDDPNPSSEDIAFTRRIHSAGEVLGIPLVDHIIVAQSGYFSFRDDDVT